jgi:hypothetical protein
MGTAKLIVPKKRRGRERINCDNVIGRTKRAPPSIVRAESRVSVAWPNIEDGPIWQGSGGTDRARQKSDLSGLFGPANLSVEQAPPD